MPEWLQIPKFKKTPSISSMKTITKLLLSSVLLLNSGALFAQAATPASLENKGSLIPVESYCDFLNASAAEDAQELYDSTEACVLRSRAPGSYRYEVMEGKEDGSINYVSSHDITSYCDWLEQGDQWGSSFLNFEQIVTD